MYRCNVIVKGKTQADWWCKGLDHGLAPQSPLFESRQLPGGVEVR